jgi:hypothetical protein
LRQVGGIPLIYAPVLVTVPFMILGVNLVRWHLLFLGARNMKKYRDFIPNRKSYRYTYEKQIVRDAVWYGAWAKLKIFWFYNCGIYCPLSIGLMDYFSYLVKIVENWWCPFYHDRKSTYANAPLDKSFWHAKPKELKKLHKNDQNCPIYDEDKK